MSLFSTDINCLFSLIKFQNRHVPVYFCYIFYLSYVFTISLQNFSFDLNCGQFLCQTKSTDYLRKDINIFSLSIFLKFCWLYFDDHSSCLIAQSVAKTLSIFQNKKISYRKGSSFCMWMVCDTVILTGTESLSSVGVHSC